MIFRRREALLDGVVREHDDLLRPDLLQAPALDLARERVPVCPNLELGASALVLRRPFFDRHDLLALVAAPPFVQLLLEVVRVLEPELPALSRARRAAPPLVLELAVDHRGLRDADVLQSRLPLQVHLRVVLLHPRQVSVFSALDDLAVGLLGFCALVGVRVGDLSVLDVVAALLAVLSGLSRSAAAKSDIGARQLLVDLSVCARVVELDVPLEMWCSTISGLTPVYHVADGVVDEQVVDVVDIGVGVVVDREHPGA